MPKFQLRLLTLVLLACTAAVLLGLNIYRPANTNTGDRAVGWPFEMYIVPEAPKPMTTFSYDELGRITSITPDPKVDVGHIVADVAVCLLILGAVFLLAERVLPRWQSARTEPVPTDRR